MRVEFTFGIGEDQNGEYIPNPEPALREIGTRVAGVFGGYTEVRGRGGWINPNGALVREQSATIIVITKGSDNDAVIKIGQIASYIRHRLNQHTVLVTSVEASVLEVVV